MLPNLPFISPMKLLCLVFGCVRACVRVNVCVCVCVWVTCVQMCTPFGAVGWSMICGNNFSRFEEHSPVST